MRIKWILLKAGLISLILVQSAYSSPPSAPSAVRIDVYSGVLLELFWVRSSDNSRVVGYEVIRNGQTVWVGDVTSYIDAEIVLGTEYNYRIAAIDDQGNRSQLSSPVRFASADWNTASCSSSAGCSVTSSSSSSTEDPPDSPPVNTEPEPTQPDGNPSDNNSASTSTDEVQPEGSYGTVYSSTSVELFWQRVNHAVEYFEYEILRDGVYVARTNGSSYYEEGLQPGTDYRYEIRPVNTNNERPYVAAVVQLRTNDGESAGSGPSTSENTSESETVGSVRGDVYSSTAAEIFWQNNSGVAVDTFEITRNGVAVGQLVASSYFDDSLSPSSSYRFDVHAVRADTRTLLGSVTLQTPAMW